MIEKKGTTASLVNTAQHTDQGNRIIMLSEIKTQATRPATATPINQSTDKHDAPANLYTNPNHDHDDR